MSELKIYQIGGMGEPLHLHDQTFFNSYVSEVKSKTTRLLHSNDLLPIDAQYIHEVRSVTVTGELWGSSISSPTQVEQKLRALVGTPTTIIAYYLERDGVDASCGCQIKSSDCEASWFTCFGQVTSVNSTPSKDAKRPTYDIDLELFSFWRPLDLYSWRFESIGAQDVFNIYTPDPRLNDYFDSSPDCSELFNPTNCKLWKYYQFDNCDYLYNPLYWSKVSSGCFSGQDSKGSYYTGVNQWRDVSTLFGDFGGNYLSMYILKNLPKSGDIELTCVYAKGARSKRDVSMLSLDDLNADLVARGYHGLFLTDELFFGSIRRYADDRLYSPAFVRRGGNILSGVHPRWTYPNMYPGYLGGGQARFLIKAPSQVSSAYIHYPQRV